MRRVQAHITFSTGKRGHRTVTVADVLQYNTSQSIDNDADSFNIVFGDMDEKLAPALDRDVEMHIQLFINDLKGNNVPIFTGIADTPSMNEDYTMTVAGRDLPSSLAVDTDALPGRWRKISPKGFIASRARQLGIKRINIAHMSQINHLITDGSEKEWGLWYRVARMKGMYMWSDHLGTLIVDKPGYAIAPTYRFGHAPKGQSTSGWIQVQAPLTITSNKQSRVGKALIYGENAKKGRAMVAQSIDIHIGSWVKKPTLILTSTTAKTQAQLSKLAHEEVFEGIVGAQEMILSIRDTGKVILQNRMARVNLPEYGIEDDLWYIVGVDRQGGPDGMVQIVRFREKGFALTKRVPDAPAIRQPKHTGENKPITSIAASLAGTSNVRYADSFVRATNEFGVAAGWDFGVFLGVLMSIASHEHGGGVPRNVRESHDGAINSVEWQPFDQWLNSPAIINKNEPLANLEVLYKQTFANAQKNIWNPRYPSSESGVGPMQLTTPTYKQWADKYGFNGKAKFDEYQGGRWNPDSNIRAGARALVEKLKMSPPADPTNADSIWIGVGRYHGGSASDNETYINAVKKLYNTVYGPQVNSALDSVASLPPGSTSTNITIPGHGKLVLPDTTPPEVRKAINWALRMLGDPYVWGGYGPHYDCSSFVTKALSTGAAYLRRALDEPNQATRNHGDTTYTLFARGRFTAVTKDNLLPGDLVFFRGDPPEHVGMYLSDGLFIHDPSPGKFVRINGLNEDYYRERYSGARRIATWIVRGG